MSGAPLRLGLIGCGRIVEEGHAPALERLREAWTVAAVADPTQERRGLLGGRFGVPPQARFEHYVELLDSGLVDAVDIAVPHHVHAPACLAAAEAGVPFLSEKPLATSLDDADAIIAAVTTRGLPAGIMHNYLHRPHVSAARAAIQAGRIGRPFLFRMESMGRGWYVGASSYDPTWRSRRAEAGGGALLDNGYHNLYSAEALLQSPATRVFARTGVFVLEQDVDDTAAVMLSHASGATSLLLAAWSSRSAANVNEVHGELGSIRLDGGRAVLHVDGGVEELRAAAHADDLGFIAIFARFAAAVRGEAPPLHELPEGRRNLALVTAGYESSRTGRGVPVPA